MLALGNTDVQFNILQVFSSLTDKKFPSQTIELLQQNNKTTSEMQISFR